MIRDEINKLIETEDIQGIYNYLFYLVNIIRMNIDLKIIYQSIKHIPIMKTNVANMIGDHFYEAIKNAIENMKGITVDVNLIFFLLIYNLMFIILESNRLC